MSVDPATKRDEVTDLINYLARTPSPTEMDFRRCIRANEDLKAVDRAVYYMHAGMIAAVRGDAEAVIKCHTSSLRVDFDTVLYINYSLSLRRIARYSDAKDIALKALRLFPGSPTAFSTLLDMMMFSGDFSELPDVLREYTAAQPDFNESDYPQLVSIVGVQEKMRRLGIPEDELRLLMSRVQGLFSSSGIRPWVCDMDVGSFDDVSHLTITFDVPYLTFEQSVEANDALCDLLAESEDLEHWDRFVIVVRQADMSAYIDAA